MKVVMNYRAVAEDLVLAMRRTGVSEQGIVEALLNQISKMQQHIEDLQDLFNTLAQLHGARKRAGETFMAELLGSQPR